MKDLMIGTRTAADIEAQIGKVLRGLGRPDPPLDLRTVRELLVLDHGYYSATEDSAVRETVSKLVIAGKQVLRRPTLLADAIRTLSLRALYLPDQRRILIDSDQPKIKHRWNEAHEIGHSIIPWHQGLMGDDQLTLTPECHVIIEAEANFAAGQLIFLGKRFLNEARSMPRSFSSIEALAKRFGNTKTSTLWRYVAQALSDVPAVALVTQHPHPLRRDETFDNDKPCRHFIQSADFGRRFSRVTERGVFEAVVGYCGAQRGGMLGTSDVVLCDDDGIAHLFMFETFFNRYEALTLGIHQRHEARIHAVGQ